MTRLKGEEVPNAVLGAILGVGIAANNDLSEIPANLPAAIIEISAFVGLILGLTILVRQGAVWIIRGQTKAGLSAILVPMIILVAFILDRARFITYGDVIVLSVVGVWWFVYLIVGISSRLSQTQNSQLTPND